MPPLNGEGLMETNDPRATEGELYGGQLNETMNLLKLYILTYVNLSL